MKLPTLPNGDRALVDLAKLRDYCLNPDHEDGKYKARVFASALGITRADAEWLRDRLVEAAANASGCNERPDAVRNSLRGRFL